MNAAVSVHGVGVVSTLGIGFDAFSAALSEGGCVAPEPVCRSLFSGDLAPPRNAVRITDFDVVDHLGRKGVSTFDRSTQFSILACKQIIDQRRPGHDGVGSTGIVLGSAGGSFKSISDFVRSSYVAPSPHMVSPMLFPNTVMNCAASQCAIWHGLRGINSTVCSGELSGLAALVYASRMLRMEHAPTLIAGSVEEFCDYGAWAHHATTGPQSAPLGEGAAVFGLELSSPTSTPLAEVLAARLRSVPRNCTDLGQLLAAEVRRALEAAQVSASELAWWSPHRSPDVDDCDRHLEALRLVGADPRYLPAIAADLDTRIGSTYAASFSLQLAAVIATAPAGVGVLTAISGNEQIGFAVIRIPDCQVQH